MFFKVARWERDFIFISQINIANSFYDKIFMQFCLITKIQINIDSFNINHNEYYILF